MAGFKLFIGSSMLLLVFAVLGFGIQGGFVGLYAVAARLYPTEFRTMGLSMVTNFLIYAVPPIFAEIMTMYISSKKVS